MLFRGCQPSRSTKTRSPPPANIAGDQINQPVEAGPVLSRKSSSAITGFRSLGGPEQHVCGYCAQLTCVFGTFQSAGSRLNNPGHHPYRLRGHYRCCGRNVVVPGGNSKRFFYVPMGLYRGIFRPETALGMPPRSRFGGPAGDNPAAVIRASISVAWPWPASTTSTALGASRPTDCRIRAR